MGVCWRVGAALLALAVAAAPLALCDCAEMNSQPSPHGHCGSSEPIGPALTSGCGCVCMSAGPAKVAVFLENSAPNPTPAALPPAVAPLGLWPLAAVARAISPDRSPPRLASFVLRI